MIINREIINLFKMFFLGFRNHTFLISLQF